MLQRKLLSSLLSTTEAEYMAVCEASKEAIWMRYLLDDMGYPQSDPTTIHDDNQGCIAISKNPRRHQRTKHINKRYHYVREKVESKEVLLKYCPTKDMVADILTKYVSKTQFENLRKLMGVHYYTSQ